MRTVDMNRADIMEPPADYLLSLGRFVWDVARFEGSLRFWLYRVDPYYEWVARPVLIRSNLGVVAEALEQAGGRCAEEVRSAWFVSTAESTRQAAKARNNVLHANAFANGPQGQAMLQRSDYGPLVLRETTVLLGPGAGGEPYMEKAPINDYPVFWVTSEYVDEQRALLSSLLTEIASGASQF